MKTKKRYLSLTTIANWAASIPAKEHFSLVISLMLFLAFRAPSIAKNAQGGKIKVDRHAETACPLESNNSLPIHPARLCPSYQFLCSLTRGYFLV